MRYLITTQFDKPFLTDYYDDDKFNPLNSMVVYDLLEHKYTKNGVDWYNIEKDFV